MFQRSVQSVANAFKKVQERAIKSTQNQREETEEEKSIKALFAERIVKGRPDLFTPSSPVPSPHSEEPDELKEPKEPKKDATTPRLNILQANLSGFVRSPFIPSLTIQSSSFILLFSSPLSLTHTFVLISSLASSASSRRLVLFLRESGASVFAISTSVLVVRTPNTCVMP